MSDELEVCNKKYTPTKEEVGRINNILKLGVALSIAERYLVGCLFLIAECKKVILNKITSSDKKIAARGLDEKH